MEQFLEKATATAAANFISTNKRAIEHSIKAAKKQAINQTYEEYPSFVETDQRSRDSRVTELEMRQDSQRRILEEKETTWCIGGATFN